MNYLASVAEGAPAEQARNALLAVQVRLDE